MTLARHQRQDTFQTDPSLFRIGLQSAPPVFWDFLSASSTVSPEIAQPQAQIKMNTKNKKRALLGTSTSSQGSRRRLNMVQVSGIGRILSL